MKKTYNRTSFVVEAEKYEPGQGMEDGFMPLINVITTGWIATDHLVQITREDGQIVCPFIQNRRGMVFIREGDYIIYEDENERHCCGKDKFNERFAENAWDAL